MKKIFKVLSSVILLISVSNVFAKDVTCPSTEKIRSLGSEFVSAYNTSGFEWVLVSDSFAWKNQNWQTLFTVSLPGIYDPVNALVDGKSIFDKSPITTQPSAQVTDEKTECGYTPTGALYKVTVVTPANFGLKRK